MAIYTIGDPHLSLGGDKPMDVFDGWEDYVERLRDNWNRKVGPEDTVVVAGDISWAMKLEDCGADFAFLHALPGHKLLLKGNHDYWWTTAAKMNRYIAENGFDSLGILHNNSFFVANNGDGPGVSLCGTRGWMFDEGEPQDAKINNRENGRLNASLQHAQGQHPEAEKIVFLHYPPVCRHARAEELIDTMKAYGVAHCYYGHLHSKAIPWALQGDIEGICYKLLSADSLQFDPWLVRA